MSHGPVYVAQHPAVKPSNRVGRRSLFRALFSQLAVFAALRRASVAAWVYKAKHGPYGKSNHAARPLVAGMFAAESPAVARSGACVAEGSVTDLGASCSFAMAGYYSDMACRSAVDRYLAHFGEPIRHVPHVKKFKTIWSMFTRVAVGYPGSSPESRRVMSKTPVSPRFRSAVRVSCSTMKTARGRSRWSAKQTTGG